MTDFVVHQHHHYGWTKRTRSSETPEGAMLADIMADHPWLSEMGHTLTISDGRYAVRHKGPVRHLPLRQPSLHDGDYWFGNRIHIGRADDCDACGGTGVSHYNPFRQCWKCGNSEEEGKSSGKLTPSRNDT